MKTPVSSAVKQAMISITLTNELNTARRPDLHNSLSMVTFSSAVIEVRSKVEMDEMGNAEIQTPALNADDASMSSLSLVIPAQSTPNVFSATPTYSDFSMFRTSSPTKASHGSTCFFAISYHSPSTTQNNLQTPAKPVRSCSPCGFSSVSSLPINPATPKRSRLRHSQQAPSQENSSQNKSKNTQVHAKYRKRSNASPLGTSPKPVDLILPHQQPLQARKTPEREKSGTDPSKES
ncbi:hypothetical protein BLNAU_25271 [Blattamonas nauphoetae]|uniref:Uncharacterized protein n=1 Tax=Blattamonas nauphoetae TaxID=2049346 RepID=A0ABQ9WP35_9EUKA|nr:hypothetical protein BLNAU_25271 [Blattamonas nauphoetae]